MKRIQTLDLMIAKAITELLLKIILPIVMRFLVSLEKGVLVLR